MVGKKPAVAGAVGSTALATSPVRVPRRARPGATRSNSGQDTGQTRSADLWFTSLRARLHSSY